MEISGDSKRGLQSFASIADQLGGVSVFFILYFKVVHKQRGIKGEYSGSKEVEASDMNRNKSRNTGKKEVRSQDIEWKSKTS